MPIRAIALLQLTDLQPAVGSAVRVQPLEDGVLLHTGADFSEEPAALTARVRAVIGDTTADRHADPRGIFFLPDVAAPKSRSYAAVIEEVGEGGVWGPARSPSAQLPAGFDAASLAGLMGQVPDGLLDAVQDITRHNPNALQDASRQLQSLLSTSGTQGIGQLLGSAGIDPSSVGLQQLVSGLQEELERDPQRLINLAQSLLGSSSDRNDDDDDDEDANK